MKSRRSSPRVPRGNPLLRERFHDPYHSRVKPTKATRCPDCGVQYRQGRWAWPSTGSVGLKLERCPACRRIADHYPAGELILAGSFLSGHRQEILATVGHVEAAERVDHPLNRIMAVDAEGDEILVSTTDVHLPHRIVHALRDAYGGTARTHYDHEGHFTRVRWERDD